jgi:hypothetical protein
VKVPEAATLYFQRGGALPFGKPLDESGLYTASDRNLLWEAWLVELKISLENHAHAAAAAATEDASNPPSALICDRGIFDSRAYMNTDEEWDQLLAIGGWEEGELLGRYSGVVALEVAPETSYNGGNQARLESYEEALEIHKRTVKAWARASSRESTRSRMTTATNSVLTSEKGVLGAGSGVPSCSDETNHRGRTCHHQKLQVPVLQHVENPVFCTGSFALKVEAVQSRLEGLLLQHSCSGRQQGRRRRGASWTAS